jgi:streptogramin lyase
VKIGLYEAGNWIDRNGDGICQTSQDLNGDGDIIGDEMLAWGQDECVLYEVVLIPGREGTYVPGTFVGGGPTPTPTPTPIGEGWFHQDVGTPLPGSVAYAAGTWTITADGHDIWDTSDDFHFVYKPVSGDCEIIARVVSITPENLQGWEKAGVMIRETLDADSKHTMMVMTGGSGGGAAFQWRASTSGNSSWMEIYPNVSPAHWVKLVRKDNTFTGYISTDGDSGLWVYQGEINIKMSPKFYIGLCHTSHRSDSMSTAVFDNVNVTVVAPDYPYAWNPIPSDGAKYMPIDVTISWSPGDFAVSHDVYFGTSSTPAFIGNQLGTTYDPGSLNPATTYYWQIVEQPGGHAGPVWSFETAPISTPGTILREVWLGIDGTHVWNLTFGSSYPHEPSFSDELTSFEAPTNWTDSYGTRIQGNLHPKTSGDYTFWIAGDDESELWLSTDDNPAHAVLIAWIDNYGWCSPREWDKYPSQQSAPISLIGGQKYYIMAIQKEGFGGDNLAVAWQGPDCQTRDVIDGSYLSPHAGPGVPLPTGYDTGLDIWRTSPRGLAIDATNNLWAGTYSTSKYYYIDGSTGMILKSVDVSPWDHHAYGAVIDKNGILWSSGHDNPPRVLRLDPSTDTISSLDIGHKHVYGLGLDYLDHLFVSAWTYQKLSRLNVITGSKDWTLYKPELYEARGVACTSDNNVWVATTSPGTVYRYDNDGNPVAEIYVGSPTGVAVDAAGKVWSCNLNDDYITRIDPATNMGTVDLSKRIIGSGGHYTYSDMTGIVSRTITTKTGTWTVVYDSGTQNTPWGTVSWSSSEPTGTSVTVKVRSSNDRINWSAWETSGNGVPLIATPNGQYLQIEATLRIISGEESPILYDLTVNRPPVANAGPDQTVEQESYAGTVVTLDGSASTDADSTPGTNDDIVSFDWYEDTTLLGSGETLNHAFPLGSHTVTLVVTDSFGQTDSDEVVIIVQDTTPPEFTLSVTPTTLWPPDHKMVLITPVWTVTDKCDRSPNVSLISITMNEGDETNTFDGIYDNTVGDGHTIKDIQVTSDVSIYLRAERSGTGAGRIYTITYRAIDYSGNVTIQSATVTVLHDKR